MNFDEYTRFADLSFEDFKRMAKDDSLSCYEKIGFPNSYRQGKEKLIFQDILCKIPSLHQRNKTVLDIGSGCSELPQMLIDWCGKQGHTLLLVDSEEMLSHLPDEPFIKKFTGLYPQQCEEIFKWHLHQVDIILAYSIFHYIFVEANVWEFLDCSLELLADGGEMLIGDIPNISKRKRFFSSSTGIQFHKEFTQSQENPEIIFNKVERHKIDDSVMISLMSRARNQGFDAYIVPQPADLPMANRREDILIRKP